MPTRTLLGVLALAFMVATTASISSAQDAAKGPKPQEVPEQAELDKKFEETMSGVVLVGRFTVNGKEDGNLGKEERYTITKVTKMQGDFWLFNARIQYGDRDVTLPLPLEVKWAGDTPVITLTDFSFPGLGEAFSARVLFYRGEYAGTWSHGKVGGQMFGRLEKVAADAETKEEK